MDLDIYIEQTITIIISHRNDVDQFTLNSDLKQYILNESEKLSQTQQIDLNTAVENFMDSLGTPEEFAYKILSDIKHENLYLLGKVLIASFLAFFPIILILIVILRL